MSKRKRGGDPLEAALEGDFAEAETRAMELEEGAEETVTVAQLDASVDAPVPTEEAPVANGRKKKDTSNPPYYLLAGVSGVPGVPNLHQTFATVGRLRKWWADSKGLVTAVYGSLSLIRCKPIALGTAAVEIAATAPEPAATADDPVQ